MVVKIFKCERCEAEGKVTLKGDDFQFEDIVCCPVCGSDIWEPEDDSED